MSQEPDIAEIPAADPPPATQPDESAPRAVIVGAGFGGLAAAIRLAAKGYRVEVLDKLDAPGGRATSMEVDGHRFDLGPTIVTAPSLLHELWARAGAKFEDDCELVALDPFYSIRFADGSVYQARAGAEDAQAEIERLFPDDLAGWKRFLKDSRERCEFGFDKLGRRPMNRVSELLAALPRFAELRADRSVHDLVSRHVRDPRLRMALSFHPLFIGGDPFNVTSMYALVTHLERAQGVHYTMGGAGALAKAMAGLAERQGVRFRHGVEAERITLKDGRATGVIATSGEGFEADLVVSNADPGHTYGKLLRRRAKARWSEGRLRRARWSMGLFLWHFGTRDSRDLWPEIGHHTILSARRYEHLVRDIFIQGTIAREMSLYLHRPSVTDPSCAPEGGDTFYALSPVPNLTFEPGADWTEFAEEYRQAVQDRLEAVALPGLAERVTASHVMTPLDFRDRYNAPHGSGFSLEPRLLQSAFFRPHCVSEEARGLYLVGAGTHPGAGIPGVLAGAEALDSCLPEAAEWRG
ncbi:phytoene desaturase family protein [Albimonas sp. CAU 1670]|uniref:phytoene desaturase family protein n=1 Tax=Albimonas sp. CAU 1670 TaxID=3032599 RepID=UPI0023DB49EF|nr:phytoene desaturase family protein [Albimonas sp. CAU 1670]MDF2231525.1 phytoene desaturase family protein [Albimonas sp. CAU 1670]